LLSQAKSFASSGFPAHGLELHAGERTVIWRQTMQNAERILRPAGFVRVHRSYLVPLRSIEDIDRDPKGPVALALRDGPRLPVSNRYAANLKSRAA
jgi:DNA-binding LytR/AlgR family response regulator